MCVLNCDLKGNTRIVIQILTKKEVCVSLRRETSSKANRDLETQTSLDPGETELQLPCRICIYVATCEEELSWHMDDEHALNTDMHLQTDFTCEICGRCCRTESDLTYHLKKHEFVKNVHPQEVQTCPYFLDGDFVKTSFRTKSEFVEHRKLEHFQKISACKNEMDGFCRFGDDKCWYDHNSSLQMKQTENINQDPELINRLVTMMDKFTERIENIEKKFGKHEIKKKEKK